jgi:O-antigen ligase
MGRPLIQPYASFGYTFLGQIPLSAFLPAILIVTALVNRLWRAGYVIINRKILPLYLLFCFSLLSFANTPSIVLSLGHSLKILTAISFYILVFNSIKKGRDINRLLWIYLLCTIVPMLFGYYQFATATGHAWKGSYYAGRRIDSLLMEYNAYGEFLCIAICAWLMLFFRSQSVKSRIVLVVILFSLTTSLLLSLNRGSWICLQASLLTAAFFYRKAISLPLLVTLCLLVLLAASPLIYERFIELSVVTEIGSKNTLDGRIAGWQALLPLVGEHPFIGNGIGAIELTLARNIGTAYAPHNDYLRMFAEGGLVTLMAYTWFHLWNIICNLRKNRYSLWQINYPLLVAILYLASLSFFQNIIYNVVVFPMFTGLLALGHKAGQLDAQAKEVCHALN